MASFRFVGYAIVSADGMLATADRVMPKSLKVPGDQTFLTEQAAARKAASEAAPSK